MKQVFEVWILAGGLSTRMGRDKSGIRLHGKRLLARIKQEAAKTGWSVRVLRKDAVERCGPLGGVFTALKRSRADAVLLLACDMPFLSVTLLKRVATALKSNTPAVFTKQGKYAGFPFALRTSTVTQVEEQIESGDFSLQTLARSMRAKLIVAKESELFDIDTPSDLSAARERLKL
ncbi:MAG: molybdenum cofactor guanylyltransferase [Limisphaerales bacterium]